MAFSNSLLWTAVVTLSVLSCQALPQHKTDVPCGTILNEPSGFITYKPFEEANFFERCIWILRVPEAESYNITLYTIGYETGLSPPSNGLITFGLNLGSHTPDISAPQRIDTPYTINGSVAILTYYTKEDRFDEIRGFSLHYSAIYSNSSNSTVPSANSTTAIVSSTQSVIVHPGNSADYSKNELSVFLFVPNFNAMNSTAFTNQIKYHQLGLEWDTCNDFIDVYRFDGGHTSNRWRTHGRLCGPDLDATLSNDDMILLAFNSDNSVQNEGFEAEFERKPNA